MHKLISRLKQIDFKLIKATKNENKSKKSVLKTILNVFSTLLLIFVVVMVAFLVFMRISGNAPKIGGVMFLRVSSASMEPKLEVGDIILTCEVPDVSELKTGDIITYRGEVGSYAGKLITHQVEVPPYKENGEYRLITRGIASITDDPEIRGDQVEGKMVCKLTVLSTIYRLFRTPFGLAFAIILILLLFSGEFIRIIKTPDDSMNDKKSDNESISSDENSDERIAAEASDYTELKDNEESSESADTQSEEISEEATDSDESTEQEEISDSEEITEQKEELSDIEETQESEQSEADMIKEENIEDLVEQADTSDEQEEEISEDN